MINQLMFLTCCAFMVILAFFMDQYVFIMQCAFIVIISAGSFYAYKSHMHFINNVLKISKSRPRRADPFTDD